ncbi:hypothetical protein QH639_14840 [Lysinibacillus sp. 1 U-2021]|uniref:hypothetical protein n=1 Tax=Lysinibacillus sp. 1 U-2021 TaxID=3039426 RepID=UPI0024804773|nr:hypothetical protein [Lysinibacillus sp. 1 U-2021]WGT37122.1 hypothetical protein QH639_14840 [Lysinibacillus sp. 1 U-2021]
MTLNTRNYSDKIVDRIMLDAGAIYLNLKLENGEFTGTELGGTQGGNEFTIESEIRQIAVDGVKGRAKGLNVLESVNPKLKVNLLEITARNLAMAIAGSNLDTTSDEAYDILTGSDSIKLEEYLDNIAFVGRLGTDGGNKPVIVVVENVLQLDPVSIKTTNKGEVVLALNFTGHYSEKQVLNGTHPYKIYYPKEKTVTPPEQP